MDFVRFKLFCIFSIAAYCKANEDSTTAIINESPEQQLQGKYPNDVIMKEPVAYFLNGTNDITGIGIIVKTDWGVGILVHVDNFLDKYPIRFEAFIRDKKLEGTAEKTLEYRQRYFVMSININVDDLSQPIPYAEFFNHEDCPITNHQELRTLRLSEGHLRITALANEINEGDEYLVSKEWKNLKSGDFLLYENHLLGMLDKILDERNADKVALYVSCHYMSTRFLICPEAQRDGLLNLDRQYQRLRIQNANRYYYDLYAGII